MRGDKDDLNIQFSGTGAIVESGMCGVGEKCALKYVRLKKNASGKCGYTAQGLVML